MSNSTFQVDAQPDGGFTARSLDGSIVVVGETVEQLATRISQAIIRGEPDPQLRPATIDLCFMEGRALAAMCSLPVEDPDAPSKTSAKENTP